MLVMVLGTARLVRGLRSWSHIKHRNGFEVHSHKDKSGPRTNAGRCSSPIVQGKIRDHVCTSAACKSNLEIIFGDELVLSSGP